MVLLLVIIIMVSVPAEDGILARATSYTQHDPIVIDGDGGFVPENGVVSGTGTASDPYVIENWQIDGATANGTVIRNTVAHFVIRNVDVSTGRNSTGIMMTNVTNARLENLQIHSTTRTKQGIWMTQVSDSVVRNSSLTNYDVAFLMTYVDRVQVLDNIFPSNLGGISLGFSTNVTISRNSFTFNGLVLFGTSREQLNSHTITPDNLVNGKPLYYHAKCSDLNIDGIQVGQLIVADCSNVRVTNLELSRAEMPLQFVRVNGAVVQNNSISSATILGFALSVSTNISVTANSFSDNLVGLRVWTSSNVTVYHNNFANSRIRHAADDTGQGNKWDGGYPSGGNFWSGYGGSDSDGDGLGDTAYQVYPSSQDRYPLMRPYPTHDVAITSVVASPVSVVRGETVSVTIEVRNQGDTSESFNVTSYYDATIIASHRVIDLAPRGVEILSMSWETSNVSTGEYEVRAIASVVEGEVDTADNSKVAGTVTVNRPEEAPILDPIEDIYAVEETLVTFRATASDPDGDPLTFTLGSGGPSGASITQQGDFTWMPTEAQGPDRYEITIIVSDPSSLTDSETVTIIVREANTAPALDPVEDRAVEEGTSLSFTFAASDPDLPINTLKFYLASGAPGGARIDPITGVFTWTPTEAQGPGSYALTVFVTDDGSPPLSASRTITITVSETNNPPRLELFADLTVPQGFDLRLQVTADDTDIPRNTLRFILEPASTGNFPTGATITEDGIFSWTPTATQASGTYRVRIVVTDGTGSDSEEVDITVAPRQETPTIPSSGNWLPWILLGSISVIFSGLFLGLRHIRSGRRARPSSETTAMVVLRTKHAETIHPKNMRSLPSTVRPL